MSAVNNIIYQSVVYLAPVLLCVLGGIFAYKANVLNIALEGMMMAGAFVSMLIANLTGSVPAGYLSAFAACLLLGGVNAFWPQFLGTLVQAVGSGAVFTVLALALDRAGGKARLAPHSQG